MNRSAFYEMEGRVRETVLTCEGMRDGITPTMHGQRGHTLSRLVQSRLDGMGDKRLASGTLDACDDDGGRMSVTTPRAA